MNTKNIFIICISILISFFMISFSVYTFGSKNGLINVKGASERYVVADKAIWNISFVSAGNEISQINQKIKADTEKVLAFLEGFKIDAKDISLGQVEFVDMDSREYRDPNQKNRFILTQTIVVNSNNIEAVEEASKNLLSLIEQDVYLKDNYGNMRPVFLFTKLDSIKNEMLDESIHKAQKTAEQFAKNSNVKVGKIKKANQGVFVITGKNKASQYDNNEIYQKEKEVRVVSTIEYYLK